LIIELDIQTLSTSTFGYLNLYIVCNGKKYSCSLDGFIKGQEPIKFRIDENQISRVIENQSRSTYFSISQTD